MAAPPQGNSSYHPEPRHGAASFTIGRKLFMFRGDLKSYQHKNEVELPRAVEVFDAETLVWNNVDSVGDHPSWFYNAAVTMCKNDAFFFGGNRGAAGYCNDLFALNSTKMSFRRLPGSGEDTRVLRTSRSGLVSLATGNLLTAGGFVEQPTHQTATDFIPEPGDSRGRGFTNQLLHYNTESGNEHKSTPKLGSILSAVCMCEYFPVHTDVYSSHIDYGLHYHIRLYIHLLCS